MISVTTPDPTVLPPSRIANRSPSSIAIGVISSDRHRYVVSRHYTSLFLPAAADHSRYVRRSEIELRSVSVEERRMSSALFLLQHVYLSLELRVRMDRSRLPPVPALFLSHLSALLSAALRCCLLSSAWSSSFRNISTPVTTTVPLLLRQVLRSLLRSCTFTRSSLYSARCYRSSSCDREYVLYRHQERLVVVSLPAPECSCLPLPSALRCFVIRPLVPPPHCFQRLQRRSS